MALLVDVSAAEAHHIAGRLRTAVALSRVSTDLPTALQVTVSVGLATARGGEACLDSLLSHADHAMYRAKHAGKKTVVRA